MAAPVQRQGLCPVADGKASFCSSSSWLVRLTSHCDRGVMKRVPGMTGEVGSVGLWAPRCRVLGPRPRALATLAGLWSLGPFLSAACSQGRLKSEHLATVKR